MNEKDETVKDDEKAPDSLLEEIREVLGRLPAKRTFLGLVGIWFLIFQFLGNSTKGYIQSDSLFVWLKIAYGSGDGDDSHGFLIPFIVLGFLWWKRETLLSLDLKPWWGGLVFLGLGSLAHLLGYATQIVHLSIVGMVCGLYGLTGLVWGRAWMKNTFFPFVLFAFSVPLGANGDFITFPLRMIVTTSSVWISNAFMGIDVVRDGSRIFDPSGTLQYDVAPACSGIRSLTALFLLSTVLAMTTLRSFWRRAALIGLTIPIAIVGNTSRIVAVIVAGEAFGQEAGMKVHDWAWIFTYGTALALIFGLSMILNRRSPTAETRLNDPLPEGGEPDLT